jgi:hypothetical protein
MCCASAAWQGAQQEGAQQGHVLQRNSCFAAAALQGAKCDVCQQASSPALLTAAFARTCASASAATRHAGYWAGWFEG